MNTPHGIGSYFKYRLPTIGGQNNIQTPGASIVFKKQIILLTVCVIFSAAFSLLLSRESILLIRSDHFSRWYATHKMVTEHRGLYDPQNGKEIVALNNIPFDPIEGSFFYPAYLIVFTLPLAWFSYPVAHFIWSVLIQLFLILGMWLISKEVKWPDTVNQFSLFLMLSILFIPNLQNTIWGQFNTIAVASLSLVYVFLRRNQYFLAGLMATGFTFKPQQLLLTLLFFLLWALIRKERWKFLLGFGMGILALWLFASLFEPNWVASFITGVRAYSDYLHPQPIISLLGIPGWIFLALLAILSLGLMVRDLASSSDNIQFAGCIILSLGIWWLYVPLMGMMNIVALPIGLILLFAGLKKMQSRLYRYGIAACLLIYGLGILGFLLGLSSPDLYGLHIQLAEIAYKLAGPIVLVLISIPLCYSRKEIRLI